MEENVMELASITVRRILTPSGELGFVVTTPEKFSFIETLGLLEAAKCQLFKQMTERYGA